MALSFESCVSAQVPTLVQHAACPNSRNVGGASSPTPDYICPLPEPSQAGNALLVGITTSTGTTLTLSDDKGNTWNQIDTATDGANNTLIAVYLALNVASGTRSIKLHRTGDTVGTAMSVSEYYNIATSSAIDVHHCNVGSASTSIASGSITPTASGDLLWQWAINGSNGVPNSTSSFTVGSQANITWQFLGTDLNDGDATQAGVYNATATINPTLTSGTSLAFDSCVMALKAATAGNAPTQAFRIVHMLHQNFPIGAVNPLPVQFASSGNLLINSYIGGGSNITTITDTASNTWTSTGAQAGGESITAISQIYYAGNATPANNLKLSVSRNDNARDGTFMLYDFVGAATSPFDSDSGGQTGNQTGSFVIPFQTCTSCLTPTGNVGGNEVVIANAGWNFGTGFSVNTPSTGLFDAATDTGVSINGPEPADQNNGWMHQYTTSISPITVSWNMQGDGTPQGGWAGRVASFRSVGPAWSGILALNRGNDWSQAGLPATFPDGETTPNPWTPPTRTQCGATLQPRGSGLDDSANIIGALAGTLSGYTGCTPPYKIVLGGSAVNPFTIASTLLTTTSNVTLRGSGPMVTIFQVTAGGIQLGTAFTSSGQTLLTANPTKGATSITTAAAPPIGLAWLTQCDTGTSASGAGFVNDSVNCTGARTDNGALFVCHLNAACSAQTATVNNPHDQLQHIYVTSVTGSGPFTVNFTPPIEMPNWSTGNTVALGWDNTANHRVVGAGIENLTVQFINGSNATMGFRNSYGSWFKGLRIFGVGNNNHGLINIVGSGNTLIANNYIYENDGARDWVSGYALSFAFGSDDFNQGDSNSLLINNSIDQAAMEGLGGTSAGTVWAYSYMQNGLGWYPENGDFYHHGGSSFLLREGNQQFGAEDDDTDGTHNLNSYFRNHYALGDNPYTTWSIGPNYRGINIDGFARFENAIGNVIGSNFVSQQVTVNYIGLRYIFEFNSRGVETNGLTQASSMRWGNYNICTGNVTHCNVAGGVWDSTEVPTSAVMPSGTYPNAAPYQNSVPANHTLPCSFFMKGFTSTSCNGGSLYPTGGTGLSWWKVCDTWSSTNLVTATCTHSTTPPFPPIGPELATIAPGGPADTNGFAYDIPAKIATDNLPIDTTQQVNYTVTASSWSGGVETLTVSGLPASTDHILGQFQLTGVAAACNAATSGPWAEYKMSGSTTTTISFLLPINPATNCNGTVKWPDIRQFDERVFQLDTGSTLAPPTNLQVTPKQISELIYWQLSNGWLN